MLTNDQTRRLHNLPKQQVLDILDECLEILGVVDNEEYSRAMGVSVRTTQQKIKDKKIKTVEIGKIQFPMVNWV